jgi:arginase family enzyme
MIPHTAPPHWPELPRGRLAAAICRHSTNLRDDPNARATLAKCRVALLGIPDDTGVSLNHGRLGAREGPHAFRAALARYGTATPMAQDASDASPPPYPHIFDAGDVIPGHDIHETHGRVTEATEALLELGLFPIAIGGGHDLTFPFVRPIAKRLPGMHGVYLDAHLDVREEVGSGMPFRRLIEDCEVAALTIVGIDHLANTEDHFRWFLAHGGRVEEPACDAPPRCFGRGAPTFVSIDLDSIDQCFAPGVSAMNPAGLSPRTAAAYAHAAGRSPDVRSFDIMELSPPNDEHQRTARLAAHLFLCFLRGFAERP